MTFGKWLNRWGVITILLAAAAVTVLVFILLAAGAIWNKTATVLVTGLGSMGTLAAAGVALWGAQKARDDTRAAEGREEAARIRAEEREEALRRRDEEREERAQHLTVRPVLSVSFSWTLTAGQAVLSYEIRNVGSDVALDVYARTYLAGNPQPKEWPTIRTQLPTAALAPGPTITFSELFPTQIEGLPVGQGWHVFCLDLRFRDILGWWWWLYPSIKPGGQGGYEMGQWHGITVGVPVHIPPPIWESFGPHARQEGT